jgi:hypothetical protein
VAIQARYAPSDSHSPSTGSTSLTVGSGLPNTGLSPFTSGFSSAIAAGAQPSSQCQVSVTPGTTSAGVFNLFTGLPAWQVTMRGASFLSFGEILGPALRFRFGPRLIGLSGRASAARRHRKKRKAGLIQPVRLEASRAGTYLVPINLTSKGKKLIKRLGRRHGRKASVAALLSSDTLRLGCTPDSLPQVPLVSLVAIPGGSSTSVPALGGGTPTGQPNNTTIHVAVAALKPTTPKPTTPGPITKFNTAANALGGFLHIQIQDFGSAGGLRLVGASGLLTSGTCPGGVDFNVNPGTPFQPFFGQLPASGFALSTLGGFAFTINQGAGGAPRTVFIRGAVGATTADILVNAGFFTNQAGRLFSCSDQSQFHLVRG